MKKYSVLLVLFCIAATLGAVSLEEACQDALEFNPGLQSAEIALRQAELEKALHAAGETKDLGIEVKSGELSVGYSQANNKSSISDSGSSVAVTIPYEGSENTTTVTARLGGTYISGSSLSEMPVSTSLGVNHNMLLDYQRSETRDHLDIYNVQQSSLQLDKAENQIREAVYSIVKGMLSIEHSRIGIEFNRAVAQRGLERNLALGKFEKGSMEYTITSRAIESLENSLQLLSSQKELLEARWLLLTGKEWEKIDEIPPASLAYEPALEENRTLAQKRMMKSIASEREEDERRMQAGTAVVSVFGNARFDRASVLPSFEWKNSTTLTAGSSYSSASGKLELSGKLIGMIDENGLSPSLSVSGSWKSGRDSSEEDRMKIQNLEYQTQLSSLDCIQTEQNLRTQAATLQQDISDYTIQCAINEAERADRLLKLNRQKQLVEASLAPAESLEELTSQVEQDRISQMIERVDAWILHNRIEAMEL